MGEARRRRLAGAGQNQPPVDWSDPANRAALLVAAHEGLARDTDPTLRGVTVILPSGEGRYISAAEARRGKPGRGDG